MYSNIKLRYNCGCCAGKSTCSLPPWERVFMQHIAKIKLSGHLQSIIGAYYFCTVRHLYICDFHKNFIQSVRNKRKRKTSDDGGESPDHDVEVPEVDLFQLQVNTLRRYKRHYKLQTRPGLNKAQLAETVSRHFRNIPVNEKDTLTYFIYMVKNSKSRLDQKSDGSKQLE
uniref:Histone deacetylase complex subunit SAP30L n=1 Tax=Esox lucius TaxID=8010 RepID=A0AAY5K4Z1_ESOLU